MKAVVASHNKKKIDEIRRILSARFPDITLLSLSDIGVTEEIEETGETFEENARIKAFAGAGPDRFSVADDSGREVDALGGRPGVYSARYAGEPCDDLKNNELLLKELSGVPDKERTGRYVSVIACVDPEGKFFTVRGTCDGRILTAPRGTAGFGYDPLFYVPELEKTFAEATADEKDSVSHRGRALRAFAEALACYREEEKHADK